MKTIGRLLALVALASVVAVLAGCSGAGQSAAQVSGAATKQVVSDHLSAEVLVTGWFPILYEKIHYGPSALAARRAVAVRLQGKVQPADAGDQVYDGTTSDGWYIYHYVVHPDQSGSGWMKGTDISPHPGETMKEEWTALVTTGPYMWEHLWETLWEGQKLEFYWSIDTASAVSAQWWGGPGIPGLPGPPDGPGGPGASPYGNATLATAAETMQFSLARTTQLDELKMVLPDGSSCQVDVPLKPVFGAGNWPIFTKPATGHFTDSAGSVQQFTISGATDTPTVDGHWTQWQMTGPGGTSGLFALGQTTTGTYKGEYTGDGQIMSGGKLAGVLTWAAGGAGTFTPVAAVTGGVTPSWAATAFEMDRWISKMVFLGPAPMY